MVQVDVFWSYGLSAGLALAAGPALKKEHSFWNNPFFTLTLLWSALIFAPSGIYLLWEFPAWETMFVARNHLSIPTWLVCLFSVTNISQGILGFHVTWYCLHHNIKKLAIFQTLWSHFAMLFVLIVGWDGSGYKRFFYAGSGDDWHNKIAYSIDAFFTAPIFYTLLGLGVAFIPIYFGLIIYFRRSSSNWGKENPPVLSRTHSEANSRKSRNPR